VKDWTAYDVQKKGILLTGSSDAFFHTMDVLQLTAHYCNSASTALWRFLAHFFTKSTAVHACRI